MLHPSVQIHAQADYLELLREQLSNAENAVLLAALSPDSGDIFDRVLGFLRSSKHIQAIFTVSTESFHPMDARDTFISNKMSQAGEQISQLQFVKHAKVWGGGLSEVRPHSLKLVLSEKTLPEVVAQFEPELKGSCYLDDLLDCLQQQIEKSHHSDSVISVLSSDKSFTQKLKEIKTRPSSKVLSDDTWIVIPAYNEEKRLAGVLRALRKLTPNLVVVDDCSADKTLLVAEQFTPHVLRHPINLGAGAATQTGAEYALKNGAEFLVHFDADGQMLIRDIPAMLEPLEAGKCDVVFGSRYLSGEIYVPLIKKLFIHRPAIILNWMLTGILLTDAHCGFRGFTRKGAQLCKLTLDRFAHATELMELVNMHLLRYQEVPVLIRYDHYGQTGRAGLKILKDLLFSKLLKAS